MNFIKLYIGDYQRDTGHLSITEHGAYLLMLQHHCATEKPLPTGRALHRLLRTETKADRDAVDSIVTQYWRQTDSGLVNRRAAEEIDKAGNQRAINKETGKKGGRPKKKTEHETESVIESKTESVSESVTETKPNVNPNHSHSQSNTPLTPQGEKKPRTAIEFKTFLADCKQAGEKPISDYTSVFDFARSIGLPDAFVSLCWNEFYRCHNTGGISEQKRYKDWRRAFRNCLERNWYRLWWQNPTTNAYELTTAGRTAEKAAA